MATPRIPAGRLPTGRAAGDGEILLAAFLEWGAGCVERLLGDFAFAVWDGRSRELLCARDPLGVKIFCVWERHSAALHDWVAGPWQNQITHPAHASLAGSLTCDPSEYTRISRA